MEDPNNDIRRNYGSADYTHLREATNPNDKAEAIANINCIWNADHQGRFN